LAREKRFYNFEKQRALAMFGEVAICTQNLAISGANQVLLNLVEGEFCKLGAIVVISPTDGPFAQYFLKSGCSVRIGGADVLEGMRSIRLAVCNTVMTAHLVVAFAERGVPQLWILHEWWPRDMMAAELAKRNIAHLNQATVDKALEVCSRLVCVCDAQKHVYSVKCPTSVIYVGVPSPTPAARQRCLARTADTGRGVVRFLTLGIVCPRKNQKDAVRLFRQFAGDRMDVALDVVGARYVRDYERAYCEEVVEEIGGDERVKLHPVTDDPSGWYQQADALLFLSVNEVTPLVIAEAALHGVPCITYDIGGVAEMVTPTSGCLLQQGDEAGVLASLQMFADDHDKRRAMGAAAEAHAERFTVPYMVREYEAAAMQLSPPVVLLDMDGVLVDWDAGFRRAFAPGDSSIDRSKSYYMEDCVPPELREQALRTMNQPGFFRSLPPMAGAVEAVHALAAAGFSLYVCTSPLPDNRTCCQDKLDWVKEHLGDVIPHERIVMTRDKTLISGDVLIDDKPKVTGTMIPTWEHILFDAPYNRESSGTQFRLQSWNDWRKVIAQRLSPLNPLRERLESDGDSISNSPRSITLSGDASTASFPRLAPIRRIGSHPRFPVDTCGITAQDVARLRDFSAEIPNLDSARRSYLRWRKGGSKGLEGNLDSQEAVARSIAKLEAAAAAKAFIETDEGVDDIYVMRKQYRKLYASWRQGKSSGVPPRVEKALAARVETLPWEVAGSFAATVARGA
jgi:5'-nucleotidase